MMRVSEYGNFWERLKDADFAKGFLTHCYHEGYEIGDVKHPEEIEFLPNETVVRLSRLILPFYFMENTPLPNHWFH